MFEVIWVPSGEVHSNHSTEIDAWNYIENNFSMVTRPYYGIRLCEDRWPEYESVMEMEKWQ